MSRHRKVQFDRLLYIDMQAHRVDGRELCDYVRNLEKDLSGTCSLTNLRCINIFDDHKKCTVYMDYDNRSKR